MTSNANPSHPVTLNTVNEVVTRRISQLQADIAEAEALLALYRAELDPLAKIAEVTAAVTAVPTVTAAHQAARADPEPDAPAAEPAAPEAPEPAAIPSHRWAHIDLQPRFRRIVDQFAPKGTVTREEINEWYERTMSPGIQRNSLMTSTLEATKALVTAGVLKPLGHGRWRFNEPPALVTDARPITPVFVQTDNPKRYSHYRLPPRHRMFLDRFSHRDAVNREEISDWYAKDMCPGMGRFSLISAVSELTRFLVEKGILARDGTARWRFVR